MTRRIAPLFATTPELWSLVEQFLRITGGCCYRAGDLSAEKTSKVDEAEQFLPFMSYLLVPDGAVVQPRAIALKSGGIRYVVDQVKNPESVVLTVGGAIGESHLIAGQLGTISDHELSKKAFDGLVREFRQEFKKVKSYYLGVASRTIT